ncbi:MAG: aminoglycoside phosphotransferase family protein [Simkaniaceae bacterium]|nr:aminoglycoside phosphotransferase family protein [Simkaniaceae bacterium]
MKKFLYILLFPLFAFSAHLELFDINKEKLQRHLDLDPTESGSVGTIDFAGDRVIKTFKDKKIFENEVAAFHKLEGTGLGPRLIGYGETGDEYIVIMERAEGVSLNSLIKKKRMKDIEKALIAIGDQLGTYHKQIAKSAPPSRFQSIDQTFADKFERPDIAKQFRSTRSTHFVGPIHRDLHPGNIFFDIDSNKLTLIDLEMMRHGPLAYDYVSVLVHLETLCTINLYGPKQIDELKLAFEESYSKHFTLSPTEIEHEKLYLCMEMALAFEGNLGKIAYDIIS